MKRKGYSPSYPPSLGEELNIHPVEIGPRRDKLLRVILAGEYGHRLVRKYRPPKEQFGLRAAQFLPGYRSDLNAF